MTPDYDADGMTLYNADCLDVLPHLSGVAAVVTDPPYGIAHRRGSCGDRGKGLTRGAGRIANDDRPFDPSPWLQWPCVLWGANWYADKLPGGCWLIWDKQERGGSGDFSEVEVAWCSRGKAIKVFRHMWLGVQRASQVGEPRRHPTEKPVALMRWCLERLRLPAGSVVLDPYAGSMTTGVACARLGLRFIGCEVDPVHFGTGLDRLRRVTAEPPLFAGASLFSPAPSEPHPATPSDVD